MAATLIVAAVAIVVLIAVRLYRTTSGRRSNLRLPPSPPALPIIGHLHLINKKPLYAVLTELCSRYGDVILLRFGAQRVLAVSSPAVAKKCLSEHDGAFGNRPQLYSWRRLSYNYSTIGAASQGPYWRALRRIAAVELLSPHRLDAMSHVLAGEVRAMTRRLFRATVTAPGGVATVQLKPRLFDLSLSVLMKMISRVERRGESKDDDGGAGISEEAREFKAAVDAMGLIIGAANSWDYLPALRWLDFRGVERKLDASLAKRDELAQRLIDAERARGDDGDRGGDDKSMIAVLLSLQKTDPEFYTNTMIKALCISMLTAGTESTASTVECAMSLLLNHPDAMSNVAAEIATHVGGARLLEESDLPNLRYLRCVIDETLRLCPPAPLLLPHVSARQCNVGGFDIPPGVMLLVNAHAVHRDKGVWRDPDEFRPERWLDGAAAEEGEDRVALPFGKGRRRCPGESLALREVVLVLGTMVQCFEWRRVGDDAVDMSAGKGLALRKVVPLEAQCTPRRSLLALLQSI